MNRRNFLRNSSLTGLSITAISLGACQDSPKIPATTKAEEVPGDDFELNELTIDDLQEKMKKGTYSSQSITQAYLDRIKKIDKDGPRLNSVIEINPDALAIAAAMDAERKTGKIRGPLHGIPVLIKDNINSGDNMQTTAGALALQGNIASKDAFLVAKLREAGAVLLGKTNLSEWANYRSNNSCSGWSSRGGQTKSPYILDHNPCGSSSGSGVAVAANLCAVAIGSETDGSITCPASVNNLVGIKPTVGLVSRSGIIPISSTQDTAGPIARTVKDAAILLGAIAGVDKEDAITINSKEKVADDYTKFLDRNGLKGKIIGIDLKKKSKNQYINRLLEATVSVLKKEGATVVDVSYVDKINELGRYESAIFKTEFKVGVNAYLATCNHKIKSLADVIAFNKQEEDTAMPYFKQELLENSEKSNGLFDKEYLEALKKGRDASRKIIDDIMTANKLDAIAGITMGPSCSIDVMYGDRWGDDFLTQPAAMSGYPHISVPGGWVYDLPVGFSFFAGPYKEGELISMAYAFEQATKNRKLPKFRKSFLD